MFGTIDPGRFGTLMEVNALVGSTCGDTTSLHGQILSSASRLAEGEASCLALLDQATGRLRFCWAFGDDAKALPGLEPGAGQGITGWVALHGAPLLVNDPCSDDRFASDPICADPKFQVFSVIAVPVKIRDSVIAVLQVVNRRGKKYFSEDDLQWLELFAVQAGVAIGNCLLLEQAREEIASLPGKAWPAESGTPIVSNYPAMAGKLELADRIASSESPVLILGESGVGKELFAERIHRASRRAAGPFVRVNCAGLPEELLETELLGRAEDDAAAEDGGNRRGLLELADGGTLYLDEIGALPPRLQGLLLRLLQQKAFDRAGSRQPVPVDVRLIAATARDLEAQVDGQGFRPDLYFRLNVLSLHIPPLRQRPDDIPALAEHFRRIFARETGKSILGFSETAMDLLTGYGWPGNVRELRNTVERAVIACGGNRVEAMDIWPGAGSAGVTTLKEAVNSFKRDHIRRTLEANGWNQTETAIALDIQRTYLSRLIKELEIAHPKE